MTNHPNAYGSAAVVVAFVAGILITLGFKDLYPDLERRYQRRRGANRTISRQSTEDILRRRSTLFPPVKLEDHTRSARQSMVGLPAPPIPVGIEGIIGNTPLFKIKSLSEITGCMILAKAEFLNGAGMSPKDRVGLNMIKMAEEEGLLSPGQGDTIYEGTVGSTGISLATLAMALGYRAHICMPNDQSTEKSDLLDHLGATVERVTPAPITSTEHFVNLARRRAEEHASTFKDGSKGFFADQFESPANYQAHFQTTGPEIWEQTGRKLDCFVAGAGTGGTISGISKYLKEEIGIGNNVRVVLADPEGSGLYNKVTNGVMFSNTEREGTRRRQQVDTIVEGIGINRLTANFDAGRELINEAVKVTDLQALTMARWLAEKDGIFVGSSSAVNCVAAVVTALRAPMRDEDYRIVTILCDSGTRHLSKFWKKASEIELKGTDTDEPGLLALLNLQDAHD
jgi:cysteine synthase A